MIVSVVDLLCVFGRSAFVSRMTCTRSSVRREPCGDLVLSDRPRWGLQQHYNNISAFYTRLACVHVEPAPLTPSTTPPLPCETHPAQRPSLTYYIEFSVLFHVEFSVPSLSNPSDSLACSCCLGPSSTNRCRACLSCC